MKVITINLGDLYVSFSKVFSGFKFYIHKAW